MCSSFRFGDVTLEPLFQVKGHILTKDDIRIHYHPDLFARKELSRETEEKISELFKVKCQANPRLYNASKFRFHDIGIDHEEQIELKVGLTDYRDLIGTHHSGICQELITVGKSDGNVVNDASDFVFC